VLLPKKKKHEDYTGDNTWSISMVLRADAQKKRKEKEQQEAQVREAASFSSFSSSWFDSSDASSKKNESGYREIESPISIESSRRICVTNMSGKDSYRSNLFQSYCYDEDVFWNTNRSSTLYEPSFDSTRRGWYQQSQKTHDLVPSICENSFVSIFNNETSSVNSSSSSFHVDKERNNRIMETGQQLIRRSTPKANQEREIPILEDSDADWNCAVPADIPILDDTSNTGFGTADYMCSPLHFR
jgi:hypothetical protein